MAKRWRVAWFVLGAVGTGLILAVLYALLGGAQSSNSSEDVIKTVRETQVDNHALLTRIDRLAHTINDCTNEGGECFKKGQSRTGQAVGDIGRRGIVTAACEVVIGRESSASVTAVQLANRITACVDDTIAKLDQTGAPR